MISPSTLFSGAREAGERAARNVIERTSLNDNLGPKVWIGNTDALTVFHDASDPKEVIPSPTETEPEDQSFDELNDRAEQLQEEIDDSHFFNPDSFANQLELGSVLSELERRSLDALESHLVETEQGEDNILSEDDLYDLANDDRLTDDVRQAAQFYLDNKGRLERLEIADDKGGSLDGKISLGDIHVRQLELNQEIDNIDVPVNRGDGSYELPNGDDNISSSESPQRSQFVSDRQQDAIEESIRTGEEVEFRNSEGQTLNVRVESTNGGTDGIYTVHVGDDAIEVTSEIGIAETISGIANIIEFGSTMGAPEGIRRFPDSITFNKDDKKRTEINDKGREVTYTTRATYNSEHHLNYFGGDEFLQNAELYYHEIGHGIGRDLDDSQDPEKNDASPAGWPEIHLEALESGSLLSNYAETNDRESFAEAFAAYVNARNYGEEALQELREEYPIQSAYIDENIFGITSAPS